MLEDLKVILASKSPRRKEILENAGYSIEVRVQDADETLPPEITASEAVKMLAEIKADAVTAKENEMVIGADTVVVLDGQILGKPKNEDDAFNMLRALGGRSHKVYTGVCVILNGEKTVFSDCSEVRFESLTDNEIYDYIKTGEPMDKAGAYGIQGLGGKFAKIENGSYYNVMGFPIEKFNKKFLEISKTY